MSKFLKNLTLGLALFMLVLGLIGFTLPSSKALQRSVVINAPASKIFPFVNNLKNFNLWSPWSKLDPDTEYVFTGPDEGIGARVVWKSENKSVGEGSQEIVESRTHEYVKTNLNFGGGGPANAEFFLDQNGGSTKVTWTFQTEFEGMLARYFGLMLDKWVGGAYEEGLQNLKSYGEQ